MTSRSLRLVSALFLAAALLAVVAPLAQADDYSVYSCLGPSSQLLVGDAWVKDAGITAGTADFDFSDTCGTPGGELTVSRTEGEGAFSAGDFAQLTFSAPANTTISAYQLAATAAADAEDSGSTLSAVIRETHTGDSTPYDYGCPAEIGACSEGSSGPVQNKSLSSVALRISCDSGPCPASGIGLSAGLTAAQVVLSDNSDPKIPDASVTGSLLGPAAIGGVQALTFTATDKGGGVSTMAYAIDGGTPVIENSGGDCTVPYTNPRPCPLSLSRTFGVDTSALTPGLHHVTISTTDAAGNFTDAGRNFTVLPGAVSATGPVVNAFSNGSPAVQSPVLTLPVKLVGLKKRSIIGVPGTLKTQGGAAISGATLDVASLDLADVDATTVSLPSVSTASDGSFTIPLLASGAKRLTVSFKPNASADVSVSATVLIRQTLSLTAKRSKGHVKPGMSVTISGVLSGAGAGTKGAPVEIDVRFHNSWRAVGVVKAAASGRYRWKYRFVRVTSSTKFTFRAVARSSKAWPWPTEIGSSVKVLVAP